MTNLGDLEVFARVVSTGSMSAAGRALGLSAAVISKRVKRLEERLGTRLLQRTTRQVSLTEAGQGFYDRVLGVLAGIEEAEAYASGRSSQAQGTLRITAPTSFGRMHIAPHLTGFMKDHPDLKLHIVLSDEFSDIVADGFDLAIRIGELTDSSLVARKLAPVRRLLCAAPGYIARQGAPKEIGDLAQHICLPAHNNESWKLEGPGGSLAYRPDGPLVTNSSEIIRAAVIAGAGIALRSTWDVSAELRDGRLVQVLPEWEGAHRLTLSAVYPSRQFLPAKVRLFVDYLAALYGPVPYWEQ
ncbi:LysR family transcriptional regulator [Sinorhizobium fredii]|uniref:LysR family transcriptional regulator n=1 Tax=Rhizobium fredii TaxID=380 RepID=A0A2A6LVX0_RHIFR|nr:LysR family transcriptional regulator [Sinorhizobium fredii]PDT46279.1 LysR family transcriptional regulator [Sinorhizobium fredii]